MSTSAAPTKEKVSVYLDPALSRLLRLEKAETKRPVTEILEDLVREHYEAQGSARVA